MAVTLRILLVACALAALFPLRSLGSIEDSLPAGKIPLSVGLVDEDGSGALSTDVPLFAGETGPGDLLDLIVQSGAVEYSEADFRHLQILSASPRSPPQAH